MNIQVEKWILRADDHLWLEDSLTAWYSDNYICDGCGGFMEKISMVKNCRNESGLVTGLCPSCGYVKRTRNLTQGWYNENFSKRWLTRRNERVIKNDYVFNKLSKYMPEGGSILDVGCGLGDRLLPFHEAGFEVYGIDPSEHRSALAAELMENIETGVGEEYLDKSPRKFDAIYFFNVLQFVENPFLVLEMAARKLSDGGVILFRVGQFHGNSNYCQFSHLGILRSFLSLYSMKEQFKKLDLWPVEHSEVPFEMILRKGGKNDISTEILNTAAKLSIRDIEQYARNTMHPLRLKILGKTSIKYQGRKVILKRKGSFDRMVPMVFQYEGVALPILLK